MLGEYEDENEANRPNLPKSLTKKEKDIIVPLTIYTFFVAAVIFYA